METVLHRLHLQGSRTIIDNLDSGLEVVPVITRYEGFFDCCESVRSEEGFSGFYRGFGALLLQYAVRIAAIRLCTLLAKEIVRLINQSSGSNNEIRVQPLQTGSTVYEGRQSPMENNHSMHINNSRAGDSLPSSFSHQQNEIIEHEDSFRRYIPASAFTDDNDPYRHVRHAM